ncbi:MAG: YkgJ family cysteine cluster protein [bacterium]|nr:YkgJ family cysteine cluster protein [bacterium]
MIIEKRAEIIKKKAELNKEENELFLEMIEKDSFDLAFIDESVKNIYGELKKIIKCEECGECCREIIVVFEDEDLNKLAEAVKEDRKTLEKRLFQKYEKFNCFVMNQSPCPFQKENLCTVYDYRGTECRDFPYLENRLFSEIYRYVFQGYPMCPYHFSVIESLKEALQFENLKEGNFGS